MLVEKSGNYIISLSFNNEILTLVDSLEWCIWMRDIRNLSDNTIRSFMKSMEKFWEWSLYNPIGLDEPFVSYQARYRKDLRKGFEITVVLKNEMFSDPINIPILSSTPLSKSTINKEIAGINSYFYFTEQSELIEDHRFINHLYERHKASKGFLAGVQIKKSHIAIQTSGKKIKYLTPYRIAKDRQGIKYFPMELFDELLEISKPRERLLYLLCGACSARIGQALNLTLYDIDYDRQEVWLIDPKSDDMDIYGNLRYKWLLEEYGIDMHKKNTHNTPDLQFKYPIPVKHEPLYWLNDKYKKLFFKTISEYMKTKEYVSEFVRHPRHPFFFTTKTGKRVHGGDALSRFKMALRKLYERHPEPKYAAITELGFHSLRHMFGHARAELQAATGNELIPYITMNEMGHRNFASTLIYFNISRESMKKLIQKHTEQMEQEMKQLRKGNRKNEA